AANLAVTAARTGDSRVALVDCDLRRGSQGALFGMGVRPGLSELLSGKCEIGEALGRFHEGQLAVIPAGKTPAEPAALLAGERFSATLETLRNLFDEIVLDVPPALATADASVVAHRADGGGRSRPPDEMTRMPQFSGHWYSGRAARLCAIEGGLVALALWTTGRHASSGRGLTALIAAAACVPAALYLADLYDPQVMRNDR